MAVGGEGLGQTVGFWTAVGKVEEKPHVSDRIAYQRLSQPLRQTASG